MNATADHLEFAPPPTGGTPRAVVLAVLAHLLLVAALTWGLHWKSSTDTPVAEAELWSRVPQQAAPKLVEAPVVAPAPPPPAPVPVQQPPQPNNADIVREREKRQQEDKKREEARQQEAREREQKQRAEQQKLAQEKKRAQEEKEQKERAEKLAQDKKREEEAKRQQALKAQQEARQLAELRKANMERIAGLAGGTGSPSSTGTAAQSSGPSASYGSKVAAKVKPNIVFTEDPANNPMAVVEVRAAPDGTITSRKLVKTSGNKGWDDAVLRAIDKTETLPRDTDGRVPSVLEISFRPRD